MFQRNFSFYGNQPSSAVCLQPVLIFGVVFHFVMGFILEIKNKKATTVKYAEDNGAANSTWMQEI